MNEAPPVVASEVQSQAAQLAESLKAFQKLTDPKERKDFYEAHPELRAIYSPVNFHAA